MLQIDNLDSFANWIKLGESRPAAALQDLELLSHSSELLEHSFPGSIFLGCELCDATAGHIALTGGVVIPDLEEFGFSVHKAHLYSVDELFAGFDPADPDGYHQTYDYSVYRQYMKQGKSRVHINVSLARTLHDHSITDALDELIHGKKVVAIMGGHGMERGEPFYTEIASIARTLTQNGFLVATGGGPGAMEAAHLGAYFATRPPEQMLEAIEILKVRPAGAEPGKEYADPDWLHRAMKVRELFPLPESDVASCTSVGIPTWFYGHEPPAPFPTHIAKYFANSIREDGLLEIAHHGVIFAPGSAGTTQEIFQDAAQNHYGSVGVISPMILFGKQHWTSVRPVWPLLEKVAEDRRYGEILALTDDASEVIRLISEFNPDEYRT